MPLTVWAWPRRKSASARRIAVIDVTFKEDPDAKLVLINPEIIHTEGRTPRVKDASAFPISART